MDKKSDHAMWQCLSKGSTICYEMSDKSVRARFMGLITLHSFDLEDVHSLRLATPDELPAGYLYMHWRKFLPGNRRKRPHYILQRRHRSKGLILNLNDKDHFKLRNAIGRIQQPVSHRKTMEYPIAA